MKLNFIGATHEVTGSCTYIEACGKRFLVDFGMEQGVDYFENAKIPCPPGNIDFVLLTHAHIDHSGLLPLLAAGGFAQVRSGETLRWKNCRDHWQLMDSPVQFPDALAVFR